MRVFEVHIKRGRIGDADHLKSPLAAPQLCAAFEVRVEDPHVYHLSQMPGWSQLIPRLPYCRAGRIRARHGSRANGERSNMT